MSPTRRGVAKKFKLAINLDDEREALGFVAKHGTLKGRALANRLGLSGAGSALAATALSCYAWNKVTAAGLRHDGDIERAKVYEGICDRIYGRSIGPLVECW